MKHQRSEAESFELESRENHRAVISRVSVRYERAAGEFVVGDTRDLSAGGMFVKATKPLPSGTVAKLEIRIAGEARPLQAVARVVWVREQSAGEERPSGMGMKFVDIDAAARGVIHCLVTGRDPTLPGIGSARPPAAFARRVVGESDAIRPQEVSAPLYLVRRKNRPAESEADAFPLSLVRRKSEAAPATAVSTLDTERIVAPARSLGPRMTFVLIVLVVMTTFRGRGAPRDAQSFSTEPAVGALLEPRPFIAPSSAWAPPELARDKTALPR